MRRATLAVPVIVAFALIGAALVATAWTMRSTVTDATTAVRDGQALAIELRVFDLLGELVGPPTDADLAAIVKEREQDGLRYVAALDSRGHVIASGGETLAVPWSTGRDRRSVEIVGGRVRLVVHPQIRGNKLAHLRGLRIGIEIEPVEAEALRAASTRALLIGGIAALAMLAVAIELVRRELRRRDEARARERERRLASLGEMSAVLAHEIKNPLASLKGNAQLLAAMQTEDKPKAKAERVVDEARRLEQLVADLLKFVRTGEIARADADVAALVGEQARDGVTIDAPAPLRWSLDADRVREVIANLVDNAVAAGPPVVVRARARGDRLVIEVSDRGPGVAAADRDKIFEPFFTNKTQGTGLGLAVARRIVELHGGTIVVGDGDGAGAVFRVEIPR
jgi:two-component system sensor histidine kinase HydH